MTAERRGAKLPPERLTVVYCPVCGRTNLGGWTLHGRHFSGGNLCRGILTEAVYTREATDAD